MSRRSTRPWPGLRGRLPCWLRSLVLALAASTASVAGLRAEAAPRGLPEWQAALDRALAPAREQPDAALAELARLEAARQRAPGGVEPWRQRTLDLARGQVLAGVGRHTELAVLLNAMARDADDLLTQADAALLRAVQADHRDDSTAVVAATREALAVYRLHCPALPRCDHRSSWRALMLATRHEARRGHEPVARELALEAATLAWSHGDLVREAHARAAAALRTRGEDARGELAQALALAQRSGDGNTLARVRMHEALHHQLAGAPEESRRIAAEGLAAARAAGSIEVELMLWANLSDLEVKAGRAAEALRIAEQALPQARALGDRRIERVLLHNATLARIHQGQATAARRTLDELLDAYAASGATWAQISALREFGDALAAAGDVRGALALYHRERKLSAELAAASRDSALAELRQRYGREAQQRQLEQLERDNALMSALLANRAAERKLWLGGAIALALAVALVALLYGRVRRLNRRLETNQRFLREQSQRDALTGLCNRRGLYERLEADGPDTPFVGALLLVDIDHFKAVNDGHGHGTGDLVLVEVARRLSAAVRPGDLVVRWGGEEFLVAAPGHDAACSAELAQRLLHAVRATPVAVASGRTLRVTVSIGHADFPLLPQRVPLTLDHAINLADLALYRAKGQGRDRAVGWLHADAADAAALRALEGDLETAVASGRVLMQTLPGGAEAAPVAAAEPGVPA